jgi:hypothetical protein
VQQAVGELSTPVAGHHYRLGIIGISIASVLESCQSFYASSWVTQLVSHLCPEEVEQAPSYASVRLWLLRFGLYKLTRPLELADDWAWIVDHTMQIGEMKCLIILGLRLSRWKPAADRRLHREDVEAIALIPVSESNGEVVAKQFKQASERCGVPSVIISDDGRDLHRGLDLYRAENPGTRWIYDIKHQTAAILKRTLERDPEWLAFAQQATRTKQSTFLTEWAFLTPPQQRGKARYMNVDTLVTWGRKVLAYLDDPHKQLPPDAAVEDLENKLGWLRAYRLALQNWNEGLEVIEVVEHYVRTEGIHRRIVSELRPQLKALGNGQLGRRFRVQLLLSLRQQARACNPGERLPGSSEIVESIIGQYKHLQGERSSHGITALILSIASNVGEQTMSLIKTAMESIHTPDLLQWCRENLGVTVQSQRKTAFSGFLEGTKMATSSGESGN